MGKNREIAEKDDAINGYAAVVVEKDAKIDSKNREIAEKDDKISRQRDLLTNLRQELANANDIIESLGIQTKTYADGNVYVGQMKNGKKDGNGTYTWADGAVYVGDWKDDKRNGKGKMTFANGDVYVGAYKDDKKHGKGTLTFNS